MISPSRLEFLYRGPIVAWIENLFAVSKDNVASATHDEIWSRENACYDTEVVAKDDRAQTRLRER